MDSHHDLNWLFKTILESSLNQLFKCSWPLRSVHRYTAHVLFFKKCSVLINSCSAKISTLSRSFWFVELYFILTSGLSNGNLLRACMATSVEDLRNKTNIFLVIEKHTKVLEIKIVQKKHFIWWIKYFQSVFFHKIQTIQRNDTIKNK